MVYLQLEAIYVNKSMKISLQIVASVRQQS